MYCVVVVIGVRVCNFVIVCFSSVVVGFVWWVCSVLIMCSCLVSLLFG